MKEKYQQFILKALPRILSNLDRDQDSPTYGSFDRHFWLYHLADFSNIILQQNCLTLALVYSNDFAGNIYYQNLQLKEWALAAVRFWSSQQHLDGSFDEYWKNEHSLPPTVFSSFAVSETIRLLDVKDQTVISKLKISCDFLFKNSENFACNQEVAATATVYSVYLNTIDSKIFNIYQDKLAGLSQLQSAEGFFYEQQGADAGYLSVSINYLAWLYQQTKDQSARKMVDKAIEFMSYFVQPDGSVGGEFGSRNTEYLLPAGLLIMAAENPLALSILHKAEEYFKGYDNFSIDDHYLSHYFGPSYAMAATALESGDLQLKELPYQKEFVKYFKEAGLAVISQKNLYLIINLQKGGVFKLYANGKLLGNDLGYRIKEKNGKMYFSEFGNLAPQIKIATDNGIRIEIIKSFTSKKYILLNPAKKFILYILSSIFGISFRKIIKTKALMDSKESKYVLQRVVEVSGQQVRIVDQIQPNLTNQQLIRHNSQSIKIIPSAKFFQKTELNNKITHSIIENSSKTIETLINLTENTIKFNY